MIKGRIKERWRRLAGADMSQNKHPENRTFSRRQKWAGLFHRALSESMPPTLRHPFLLQNNILVHNLRGNTASNWLVLVCIITGNANRTVMTSFFFLSNAWWCELSGSRRHHEPGVRFANFIESHKTSISFFFFVKEQHPNFRTCCPDFQLFDKCIRARQQRLNNSFSKTSVFLWWIKLRV